eukprot:g7071.t1
MLKTCTFYALLIGEVLWHVADLATDALYYTENIEGDEFQRAAHAPLVGRVALVLLCVNGLFLLLSQGYLVRTSLRIRRAGLERDPSFCLRIARVRFCLLGAVFALEDLPGLAVFAYVQHSVGRFGALERAQLGTTLGGCLFFLVLACRRFRRSEAARREALQATVADTQTLWSAALTAFRADVRARDPSVAQARGAAAVALREPGRAKRAKREFDQGERQVSELMQVRAL